MIKILFFGRLSDLAQPLTCELPNGVATTQQLEIWLGANNSAFAEALSQKGNRIAVNQGLVTEETPLKDGDEIAFMSPLSGG